jgi:hypothetical protein
MMIVECGCGGYGDVKDGLGGGGHENIYLYVPSLADLRAQSLPLVLLHMLWMEMVVPSGWGTVGFARDVVLTRNTIMVKQYGSICQEID